MLADRVRRCRLRRAYTVPVGIGTAAGALGTQAQHAVAVLAGLVGTGGG